MNNYLEHHGILGMHWGVRRYQNPDGSYTQAGKDRYYKQNYEDAKKSQTSGYRSSYDRMLDYSKKNEKLLSSKRSELSSLANKVKELDDKKSEYEWEIEDKAREIAFKNAENQARKDIKNFDSYSEKDKFKISESYMYDSGFLDAANKELLKNNNDYNQIKKQYKQSIKDYKTKCASLTDDIIGSYGNEKIKGFGTDMNYRELVYYALSKPNTMWMFTYEEDMGRK